jgi:hypothetical protein
MSLPYPESQLLERAVRTTVEKARRSRRNRPVWGLLADLFLIGSTNAAQICDHFEIDPVDGAKVIRRQAGE